jgi:hypothetical protein
MLKLLLNMEWIILAHGMINMRVHVKLLMKLRYKAG